MIRLAADENFNYDIVRGLLRRNPEIDIIRVQEAGLAGADDPTILEWAANENRVLLTQDVQTITYFAYERVRAGKPMPDVFEIRRKLLMSTVIDDLLILAECSVEGEWEGQVHYLPL